MNLTGRTRLVVGTVVASGAVALGIGGLAYATGDDPAPDQGYVTFDDSADGTTPAPNTQGTNPRQGDTPDRDCPEKDGTSTSPQDQGTPQSESPDVQGQA